MIIKSIRLQNIRSYKEATLEFPLGKTLFAGDIGSGKSSVLMAMEFALFGLGSERGASLLRAGAEKGNVTLVFDVGGVEYVVSRNLVRKAGKIQQAEGELSGPSGSESLSPRDMKERMLQILGFNEPPDPKSQSVIFRYAVYTPQETMKEILGKPADQRLETLRKAFGVEEYRTARDNAFELGKTIQSLAKEQERRSADLSSIQARIREGASNLEQKRKESASTLAASLKSERKVSSLREDLKTLQENERELRAANEKMILLEKFQVSRSRDIGGLGKETELVERRAARLRSQVESESATADPTPKAEGELVGEISGVETHIRELRTLLDRTDSKIEDYRTIRETRKCATCDREANPNEFVEKERVKASESRKLVDDIANHDLELSKLKQLLELKKKHGELTRRLGEHRENLSEALKELESKRTMSQTAVRELEETEDKLFKARKEIEQLSGVSKNIERLNADIDSEEEELRSLRSTVDRAEAEIKHLEKDLKLAEEEVVVKDAARKKAATLRDYAIWIEDYFVPTLEAIERQVMTSINQDFNSHFQGWFATLVEDQGKEARIDEDFVPFVEQDGYEQEVDYLSGGERTSLALAYRLALNEVVQRVSTGMKSNLLILDEPTDGFSSEQLGKMREILDEIESPQVILVSHDKELESFADQTYWVVKEHGESRIISSPDGKEL